MFFIENMPTLAYMVEQQVDLSDIDQPDFQLYSND